MDQIKKKQHYVWKKYLSAWSKDSQISTLLKLRNKIIHTALDRVGQERFFYALEEFTEEEENNLKDMIIRWSSDNVLEINMEFYHTFTSYSKIKRALKNKDVGNFDMVNLDHSLSLLRSNTVENIHSRLENLGEKLISIRKFEDLRFLEDQDELFNGMLYVSFQYLRTKNMSETVKPVIPKFSYLSDKFINIFPFIYAPALAYSLTFVKEVKFIFYDNQTEIDFITSDQPLINVKGHILRDNGVAQMDLYYPLSPKIAILIHYQEQREKYQHLLIEKEQIIAYNQQMFNSARDFIFAHNSAQLEHFIEY